MQIAKVVGSAVATVKNDKLRGAKLLVVEPVSPDEQPQGAQFVAEDAVGAGQGDVVLIVTGGPARAASTLPDSPVDAVVVAIVDSFST